MQFLWSFDNWPFGIRFAFNLFAKVLRGEGIMVIERMMMMVGRVYAYRDFKVHTDFWNLILVLMVL